MKYSRWLLVSYRKWEFGADEDNEQTCQLVEEEKGPPIEAYPYTA